MRDTLKHRAMFWYICGGVGILALSLCIALYKYQNNLLYFPQFPLGSRRELDDPANFKLKAEDIYLTTRDGVKIHCWFFLNRKDAPTMLYFHGNAGNISHRLIRIKRFIDKLGCNVMIVGYRGYGLSSGDPTESGINQDAQVSLEYLLSKPEIDTNKIFIYGESLGGAVAVSLTSRNQDKVKAIIVENTFTSIPDMVVIVFPILSYLRWLASSKWDSLAIIRTIKNIPILFISGTNDELVPPFMMQKLFDATVTPYKELRKIHNGTHNESWLIYGYDDHIRNFLIKHNLIFHTLAAKQ